MRIIAVMSLVIWLTGASEAAAATDPAAIALAHARAHTRLDRDDLAGLRLSSRYTSLDGVTHLIWKQRTRGIEAYNRFLGANVAADGRLINLTGAPIPDLELDTITPKLTRADVGHGARLVAFATSGDTRLAWQVRRGDDEVVVDARSGRVLARRSLASDANAALVYDLYPDQRIAPRTVNLGADPSWIDRSQGGTRLEGNNAHASTFVEFTGDPTEVAQVGGNWSFPVQFFNHAGCPAFGCTFKNDDFSTRLTNREQTATQAFYFVNHFHDHALAPPIGFDEASRNFEHVNASGSGLGGDAINVLTNHSLPDGQWIGSADGDPPEMRLGKTNPAFGFPYDVRISDSAAVVYHEYAHGLTGRLVGAGTGCCPGVWGNALAEGWSDWYAMDLLVAEGDVADGPGAGDVRFDAYFNAGGRTEALDCPVAASAAACPGAGTAGSGGYTFGDFGKINPSFPLEEHGNGEIWGQTLWDLRARVGGVTARCLVTGGLRLSPASPGFLDARDAILQHALVVGVPQATVWEVFAARGMGPDADDLTTSPTEDFDVPDDLPPAPPATGRCTPPPSDGDGTDTPPPPPAGGGGGAPTRAQIAAALGADIRAIANGLKRAGIRRLLRRRGFTARGLDALTEGRFAVRLDGRGRVIAKGRRAVGRAGRYALKVKLTARGRQLLRDARRIKVTLTVRFTPAGGLPVKRSTKAKLKR